MAKIGVLGAGGFGTALAVLTEAMGHTVTLWSAVKSELAEIMEYGENRRLLPGIEVPVSKLTITDREDKLSECDIVLFAVSSVWVRPVAKQFAKWLKKDAIIANVAKGFEQQTHKRLSQVIEEEIPGRSVVALSGPSHAEEIARGIPTTIVAASKDITAAEKVQELFNNLNLRIYVNADVIGVEYGGALKNIIALAAGICDGLSLGDNTKAALMTRGITEVGRLGVAAGAKSETFAGLSGIGDLIVTCTSMHSRNRRAGILIGQGKTPEQAIADVGMTVEGYPATKAAMELAEQYGVSMPITEQLYQVLFCGADIRLSPARLMGRPVRHESEEIWFG